MRLTDLPIPAAATQILTQSGITQLYPPQQAAVEAGLLTGKNLVLATPTASGKTLTAELAILKALTQGKKAVYIVPLRALAYEKSVEFKRWEKLGYRIRLETGDLDSKHLPDKPQYDILVATAEKCDSILRSKPDWFRGIGLLVLDEIHLIATDRGPVYEILASKIRGIYPDVHILGLSATIGNGPELANWLNAKLVESNWRPIQLTEKVEVGDTDTGLKDAVKKNLAEGGQALVFVNSRKSAEATAEQIAKTLKLPEDPRREKLAEKIEAAINPPTKQCHRLAQTARNGTAFHHAGLINTQRTLIEDAFKDGTLPVLTATPTLAAGVNLPSRTVIIRDIKRYTDEGLTYIPVLEYKQMAGRAGRPKYDPEGRVVTLARNIDEAEYIIERYVNGTPEPILSQLGVRPTLRFHLLASIASRFTRTPEAVLEFFRQTFFGHQYGMTEELSALLTEITGELVEWGFVTREGRFLTPTPLGERISELYIDPLTAHKYQTLLTKAEETPNVTAIGLLEALCDATEITKLHVKPHEESPLWTEAYAVEEQLLRNISGFDLDWEFLPRFKTACLFSEWIQEKTEDEIMEKYSVAPGQLYQRLENLQWLAYAATEISRLLKHKKTQPKIKALETQIKYGVAEDLLPLVQLKGIGRVRARKLYAAGLKTPHALKKQPRLTTQILGPKTAEDVLKQLE
ncbi:ATP-dependent DNA helicase Hel308 [uncultured archaeon]|nr:ATP-dependent DNA helicase Hel308 [uncultured archaeon]